MRRLFVAALLVFLWTGRSSTQQTPLFLVIVNKENPVRTLQAAELRRIFLKQSRMWPHGEPMVPVEWDSTDYLRQIFAKTVLNRTVREMADYWVQQSVQQGLSPPSTQRSARAILRFVANVPGAISYVRPAEVDGSVAVVQVDGLEWR